ncbi:MAG: hypothetical protein QNJ51_20110 [Calothrix sp. MO_167.B12]|nr:hypothetical protein [Calothrix sp. MO_167.B12]
MSTEKESIIPPSDLILTELDIDPSIIKSIKPRWKRTQYRAVVNWITKYKTQPSAVNLEKVKGILESFHHVCELEDWEKAQILLFIHLYTPTKEQLHNQLFTWGYYQVLTKLYNNLLEKTVP